MTTASEPFEEMLTGGHHNSLGRTVDVVELVLADPDRLDELYQCYFSADEVVRLRVSSVFKRIAQQRRDLLVPLIPRFLTEISEIEQASTQWTLALLFEMLTDDMSGTELADAQDIVKRNLTTWEDWIVLNYSMEALTSWAKRDEELRLWLIPHLEGRRTDARKAVAKRAEKMLALL